MRVFAANNYPLLRARERFEAGEYPEQHLWGLNALTGAGHDVTVLPYEARSVVNDLARGRAGDVAAQVALLRAGRRDGVAYSAHHGSLAGVAALRRLGLWRQPMVGVVHPRAPQGLGTVSAMKGYDVAVCLSPLVRDDLVRAGRRDDRTLVLGWGPDLDFPGYRPAGEELIVSTGRTGRDLRTLVAAAELVDAPFRIHVDAQWTGPAPTNVDFAVGAPYSDVLDDLCRAAVVAISLLPPGAIGSAGLTEINDALALGKPIVMTANPYIDVDLVGVGCGRTVGLGDVAGWAGVLGELWNDAAARAQMGRSGRAYAERGWNAKTFGEGIVSAVALAGG